MSGDVAVLNERLQDVAARMLGMEPGDVRSSATDSLKVGVASVLLLELDSLTGAALAGQPVDLARLSQATTLLAKMMPSAALEPKSSPPEGDAREKLRELFEGMARAREFEVDELRGEVARLKMELESVRAAAVVSPAPPAAAAPAEPPPAAKPARAPKPPAKPADVQSELDRLASREPPRTPASSEGFSRPWDDIYRRAAGSGVSIRAKSWDPPPGW